MNDNFRLVYSKKDISEVEQKLLEKFAEADRGSRRKGEKASLQDPYTDATGCRIQRV